MTGGKKDTAGYIDELFKNVIIEPAEVKADGLSYFDDMEDGIDATEKLLKEVESFLRKGK